MGAPEPDDNHLHCPQGASFGDVNADGRLEVAFATNTGAVYLVDGSTGHDLPGFPFRTRGRIMAPVLLTRALAASPGLQAVVPSSDGHLYVIDAATGTRLDHNPRP